jgi:hypothetical protein
MISCTEFIPAYSELFAFIEKQGGHNAVENFWRHLSDNGIETLRRLASEKGLRGCYEYWTHTLNEEAADFTMTLDEEAGKFTIDMHHCPSKGKLLELKSFKPYYDYCGHCDLLYRCVLEPLGFKYEYDMSGTNEARCRLCVSEKR